MSGTGFTFPGMLFCIYFMIYILFRFTIVFCSSIYQTMSSDYIKYQPMFLMTSIIFYGIMLYQQKLKHFLNKLFTF